MISPLPLPCAAPLPTNRVTTEGRTLSDTATAGHLVSAPLAEEPFEFVVACTITPPITPPPTATTAAAASRIQGLSQRLLAAAAGVLAPWPAGWASAFAS